MLNLLSNAFKFTKQGHVYLNVLPEDHAGNRYIRFDVEDTGIGIPLEKQESVFEQFTQADGRTTRKYGGTGLGLAITKQLAALLGGELTLTSELGKGSVFSLAIPVGVGVSDQHLLGELNDKGQENEGPQTTKQSKFAGHVLVAEDVKTNQVLARLLLEKMGLDVTVVDDGAEAVESFREIHQAVVLMDLCMPVMDGNEAFDEIRKACEELKWEMPSVVFCTGYDPSQQVQNAIAGNPKHCLLRKPVTNDTLTEAIKTRLLDAYL